ncbi:hypothetical protein F4820DRAFT_453376 [Hypoxylon rubiginosum]|uniref:Uncharacterized protein n=1 Tax=Hypoxylon rubiginosum TaxID=110542 RepID=A0ACB9YMC9_9PEZI|nr:hypothetical protein F4820DRAFT_453376 [Hypoxylon rubiginosum]
MTTSKETRPTPQSLPRLKIPAGLYEQEPEEITVSRAGDFLKYCQQHKRAPITRLPSFPRTNSGLDANSGGKRSRSENIAASSETCVDSPADPYTLAFTANEWDDLDAKEAELKEVKRQHEDKYTELLAFGNDRNAIQQCRQLRLTRERLNLEIATILKRRDIRRKFRKDFNDLGMEGW